MVEAVRRGTGLRAVARQFRVSLHTVQRWVQRTQAQRLDRVEWRDRPSSPHTPQRTSLAMEDLVLTIRHTLKEASILGEYGAAAIQRELRLQGVAEIPSLRTIGRILLRRGALDARHRIRRPAPPPGWYLPEVAQGQAELDSFDIIEGLVIQGGLQVDVLTGVALHGGLIGTWPTDGLTAKLVSSLLITHWEDVGVPDYAQFDNDTRFHGPHHYPDVFSSVTRLCLSLNVVPVFAPPQETGFQAAIESFNGRWQAKVWARFHHASLAALQVRSAQYVAAYRARTAARRDAAPSRRPFPPSWQFNPRAPLQGQLIFLRRTSERGAVTLLGRTFPVAPLWPHRLVRCEVDFEAACIRFYALRRRDPNWQPLLTQVPYAPVVRTTTRPAGSDTCQ